MAVARAGRQKRTALKWESQALAWVSRRTRSNRAFFRAGRRVHLGHAGSQMANGVHAALQLHGALGAPPKMGFQAGTFTLSKRAEDIGGYLFPGRIAGHDSAPSHGPMDWRSFSNPRRIRVFTVPRGCLRSSDISTWVNP